VVDVEARARSLRLLSGVYLVFATSRADRNHFWDGATWRPIPEELPENELEGKAVFGDDNS
jgi:hypothetical protein